MMICQSAIAAGGVSRAELSKAFRTLEIKQSSTFEEAKTAFRKIARKHHPDRNPGNEEKAKVAFQEAQRAIAVLETHFIPKTDEHHVPAHPSDIEFAKMNTLMHKQTRQIPNSQTANPIESLMNMRGNVRQELTTIKTSSVDPENKERAAQLLSDNFDQWLQLHRDFVKNPAGLANISLRQTRKSAVAAIKVLFGPDFNENQITRQVLQDLIDYLIAKEFVGLILEMKDPLVVNGFLKFYMNQDKRQKLMEFIAFTKHRWVFLNAFVERLLILGHDKTVVEIYQMLVARLKAVAESPTTSVTQDLSGLLTVNEVKKMESMHSSIYDYSLNAAFVVSIAQAKNALNQIPATVFTNSDDKRPLGFAQTLKEYTKNCAGFLTKILRDGIL